MLNSTGLLYICAAAGFIVIVGSMFLLAKGRIYIDSQTKDITDIELPFGIKMKTNAPTIMMFLFGAVLLAYPVWQASKSEVTKDKRIYLTGKVESTEPVKVSVLVAERAETIGDFNIEVPLVRANYILAYTAKNGTSYVARQERLLNGTEDGFIKLDPVKVQLTTPSSDVLSALPAPLRTEDASALSEFR